jgi:ATP-binding cassette subfamily B protein
MSETNGHKPDPAEVAAKARAAAGPGMGRMAAAGAPVDKPRDFGSSGRRLVRRLRPERVGAFACIVLALGSVTLTAFGPKVLGHATDIVVDGLGDEGGIDFGALHRTLFFVVGLFLAASCLSYLQSWLLAGVVQRTMYRLRDEVEQKLHRVPLAYLDGQPRGDLLSRVTNDIDNVAQSLQQTTSQLLSSLLGMVSVVVMMVVISPLLAIVSVVTIPVCLFTIKAITRRSKTKFIAQWTNTGMLNAHVEEAFTGHALVKVFGRQADVEARFNGINDELYDAGFSAQFISGIVQPAMMFLGNLNYAVIAVVGGVRVSSGAMTLGEVQAFIQYSRQFTQPLTWIASMVNTLQSGVASAERVFALLDAPDETPDVAEPAATGPTRGRVEFDRVSFAYDPAKPLIQNLSLVAEPGRTVAIVGPTGAGKTTLVNLIMRFYELDAGTITLDHADIARMPRRSLRSRIGMVLQDTWLFGGTIRDNIAYGNPGASEEQILEAARATYVDRFVHSLPDGYDTVIDGEGANISAGEKQLITIARAFLADPAILILDEATSSVDTRTELLIQQAMTALRSSRTSFVIAHRLSTIRDADVILVMEDGRIVEQGSHDQLLAAGGAYWSLYHAQFAAPAAEVA